MLYLFDRLADVDYLLSRGPSGLIIDVDGTIAPIAPAPELASVTPLCRRYLLALARLLPLVAAVSGRPAREARRLVGVPSLTYVGNHGLEQWQGGKVLVDPAVAGFRKRLERARLSLSRTLDDPGVRIEGKGATLSIHYRLAADPDAVRRRILASVAPVAAGEGLRVTEGRLVVEVRPPVELDKGTAVMRLVEAHRLGSAIYLGDDLTDIDAFSALRRWRETGAGISLSVAVLSPEVGDRLATAADAHLNGVGDVERFLAWLADRLAKAATDRESRVDAPPFNPQPSTINPRLNPASPDHPTGGRAT